jgi:AmmeMemoRadiSam system protein A
MMNEPGAPPTPNDNERRALLSLARASLRHQLETGGPMSAAEEEAYVKGETSRLALNCFVSLHKRGDLRGCIGTLTADKPLFSAVATAAISAGVHDPRFPSVTIDELEDCEIEISVLGPFAPIASVDEIEVGQHGLLLESDFHRGLLLPQVASRYNWTPVEFLRQTFIKAGLEPSDTIGAAKVSAFGACVFDEGDLAKSSA